MAYNGPMFGFDGEVATNEYYSAIVGNYRVYLWTTASVHYEGLAWVELKKPTKSATANQWRFNGRVNLVNILRNPKKFGLSMDLDNHVMMDISDPLMARTLLIKLTNAVHEFHMKQNHITWSPAIVN